LARRIGAIPNDSWVLKPHTLPHREGQSSHQASPPPSLPSPPPCEAGQFNAFFSSLALITTKSYSLVDINCRPPHQLVIGTSHRFHTAEENLLFTLQHISDRSSMLFTNQNHIHVQDPAT